MKKGLFLFALLFLASIYSFAQRYAVIDSRYILEKLPEYKESQERLNQYSAQWQQEIEKKQADFDRMYKDYDAEQVMLSDELKKKREDELYNKKKKCAICKKNVSVLRAICSKKDKNSLSPFKIKFLAPSKN